MATGKPVWGIDLGQSALKAIRLRVAGDKVEAVDHFYYEHPKILSQPDADRTALIAEAMKKFTADHDLTKETLVVAVPGQHTLARFTKLPPVNKKKIPEIVKYEAQQQIPFDMEEVIWDYQTFDDAAATETQVGIFAMRRELLRSHLQFLSSLNLEPALVQSAPLALYNALRYDGIVGKEPITILDIGAQNTDLIVVDGDSLWTRNIPIGGNNFTEALLKTFKLSFNRAEKLKRTAASSKYARQIFQAMRPVFADLVAEVQRSIGFFTSSRRGVKLDKLLAMGNAFKLPGMLKFVQQNLGMDVQRPTTFNKLSASEAANAPQLIDQLLSYGVAYGLAIQGLGKAQITSNLLPPEIAKQVVWRKKTPWFYGAAACLMLSTSLVWFRNMMDAKVVEAATTGPSASISDAKAALAIVASGPPQNLAAKQYAQAVADAGQQLSQVLSEAQSKNQEQINETDELSKLQSYKLVWPRILHLIHGALPKGDEKLNEAMRAGPEEYKKLIQSDPGKYERGKREQIFIEKYDAVYSEDVMPVFQSMKQRGGRTGGGAGVDAAAAGAPKLRGFVITIRARTPYAQTTSDGIIFVNKTLMANLRKASAPGIYLDKLEPPLWWDTVKEWKTGAGITGGGGGGGLRRPAVPARETGADMSAGGVGSLADKDPVTGEAINDTAFEIMFVAVLGEKPAVQPQPGSTAEHGTDKP